MAAHSCQRGSRRPCLGAAGTAKELHAPNSSTNRKCKQKPKLHRHQPAVKAHQETQPRLAAQRPQETLQHPSDVSPVGTSFQAPRWASTPPQHPQARSRPALRALPVPARNTAQPLAPHSLCSAPGRGGAGIYLWVTRLGPPQLGTPLCAHWPAGHPGPGRFLFALCPGTDTQTDPQGGDSKQEGELSRAQSRVDRPQD